LGVYSSDSSATLVFNIAATGGNSGNSANGLPGAKEIALTEPDGGTITPPNTGNSTLNTNINSLYNEYGAGTTTALAGGTGFTDLTVSNSQTGSFAKTVALSGGDYGLTSSGANPSILANYTSGTIVDLDDFASGATSTTEFGTFTVSSNGNLTYNTLVAAPEPSTYALMFGGLVALWAYKRRRSSV